MRILVLSTAVPFPPVGGGKLRTFQLLKALVGRHQLTLAGFTYGQEPGTPPFPVRVVAVPWEPPPLYRAMKDGDTDAALRASDRLDRQVEEPWCVSWAESDAMDAAVRELVAEGVDLVILEGTPMARFLPAMPLETPRALDFMDVYTRMALRQAEARSGADAERAVFEAERTRRYERRAASRCDLCLAVSEPEAAAARDLLGVDRVEVIPNGVDTAYFAPAGSGGEGDSLLFTGTMSYGPNAEAVRYFVGQVLPLIRGERPGAVLHVVGASPPEDVSRLNGPGVVVHGLVPDMRPHFREAAVVVVPLLRGGGTKLKVLEAAASGKAIVSTPVGVEGLPFRDGEDLIVADSNAEFARAVAGLLGDPVRRHRLGLRARQVSLQYDWDRIGDLFRHAVGSIGPCRRPAPRQGLTVADASGTSS